MKKHKHQKKNLPKRTEATTKVDIIVFNDSRLNSGNQRTGQKVKSFKLPKEFIRFMADITNAEVCVNFEHEGIHYSHTLKTHPEDKESQRIIEQKASRLDWLGGLVKELIK